MNRVKNWLGANLHRFWFSVLLNAVLLTVLLLLLVPVFETNDDSTMYLLTGGGKGAFDEHLIFIHILIGRLCVVLYTLFPAVQWYSVLQYVVIFASFTTISYVLFNRLKTGMAAAVFGTLYCYFAYECYIILQFSKTAGVASCAGILLMFYGLEQVCGRWTKAWTVTRLPRSKTKEIFLVAGGLLLALLGSMYRFKEFFLCAGVMSGIGVYELLCLNWRGGKKTGVWKAAAAYLGSFVLLFLLAVGLYKYDVLCYKADEAWGEYRSYNDLRSNLMDYRFPDYDAYQEVYERLGMSRADQELYRSCNYADPELFDRKVIETLTEYCTNRALNRKFVTDYFARFPVGFLKIHVFSGFLLICIYWIFYGRKGKAEIAALFYETAMVGLAYAYLFYIGRSLISRTETPLWLAASLFVVWILYTKQVKSCVPDFFTMQTAAVFVCFALAFNLKMWQPNFRFSADTQKTRAITAGEREFQEMAGEDKEHLYLTKIGTLTSFLAYEPFDVMPREAEENRCTLGGWEYGSPTNDAILSRFGISNPYRDMTDNSQVIVVDDQIKATLNYLRAHYAPEAEADLIKTAGGRKFYSIRSKPLWLDEGNMRNIDAKSNAFVCDYEISISKKELKLTGVLYEHDTDSFAQRVYLKLTDTDTGAVHYFNAMTRLAEGKTKLREGLYGGFECSIDLKQNGFSKKKLEQGFYEMELILENENGYQVIPHLT